MKRTQDHKGRLDAANVQLSKELWLIKSGLAVYQVIGLNVKSIKSGGAFFGLAQKQSLDAVVLGLAKVFERDETHELCSIRGVHGLAKQVQIRDIEKVRAFVSKYGISASGDWIRDVERVFSKQRPRIQRHLQRINRVRNTRLAHIQQNAPSGSLPSIAAFEDLLGFAFDFHSFVNEAFLSTHSHPILNDRQVESSLLSLLKETGLGNPVSEFEDI